MQTSDERVNRVHRMAGYSVMSNMMSTFTDCPGREKLAYPADYLQPYGVLHRHFEFDAYLRTMQRHLEEGQSKAGDNVGNVALKAPVYDWGYTGRFGDEINWGDGIVLVPWQLYESYGDTRTMTRYYPQMQAFMNYIATRRQAQARTPISSTPHSPTGSRPTRPPRAGSPVPGATTRSPIAWRRWPR